MRRFTAALLALALQPALPADLTRTDELIVAHTNAFRRSQGLPATAPNAKLSETARGFAAYMARTDRYGHEADGSTPALRAQASGYAYCLVSENIGLLFSSAGFGTGELARQFVDGWEHSPGHRQNMLEPDAVEIGVAVAQSPRSGRYYAVQMFGRPASMRVRFRIANRSPAVLRYDVGGEHFQLAPNVTRTHEQCHADAVVVQLPGQAQPTTLQPADGERYVLERAGRGVRLVKG